MTHEFGTILFYFVIVVPSAVIHEYAHALAADLLGDSTARDHGRLTLNPVAHIDVFGTILLPLLLLFGSAGGFMFAYAKPVPYNPQNLRNRKWGPVIVGLAGPCSNILLALVFSLLLRLIGLDGAFSLFLYIIVAANVGLAVFNLLPIPPLDGSKLLYALFPNNFELQQTLERYGFVLLFIIIFFAGNVLSSVVRVVLGLFLAGIS